jgi:hypothetical protein
MGFNNSALQFFVYFRFTTYDQGIKDECVMEIQNNFVIPEKKERAPV